MESDSSQRVAASLEGILHQGFWLLLTVTPTQGERGRQRQSRAYQKEVTPLVAICRNRNRRPSHMDPSLLLSRSEAQQGSITATIAGFRK
jgi:hypothetical protein